jgi:two-component system, chemotaxis family, protein-glutamate methylesterase/glutaminase
MDLPPSSTWHDVVVIGGSSGCFGVLREILQSLPRDFPATVLIAAHVAPFVSLANIIGSGSSLPIKAAESGERLQSGQVYLAVPDAHLLVHDHHLLTRRGPRENLSRPAIDPLFRSAACAFGPRVIGVLLSGYLNDGSAGLDAIKTCGGLTVVQAPRDAEAPSMPQKALEAVEVDHCVPGRDIAPLLNKLVQEPPGTAPGIPPKLQLEVAIAAQETAGMDINEKLGERSPFTCPDCDGVLWQMDDDRVLRFRCHIGHAVTADAMLAQKDSSADAILERLLRTHEERAELARKLAARAAASRREANAQALQQRAMGYEEDASIVRDLLSKVTSPSRGSADD